MPISKQQKEWLERFCKANRYQLDREQSTIREWVVYKKPISNNMLAYIAYGPGSFTCSFLLVANRIPFKGNQAIPWPLIGDGVNDLKLQLMSGMHAAYEEVFDKVLGCGLDELKKIE